MNYLTYLVNKCLRGISFNLKSETANFSNIQSCLFGDIGPTLQKSELFPMISPNYCELKVSLYGAQTVSNNGINYYFFSTCAIGLRIFNTDSYQVQLDNKLLGNVREVKDLSLAVAWPKKPSEWASSTGLTAVSKFKPRLPAQCAVGIHCKGPSRMVKVTSRMNWPIRNSTQIRI